MSEEMIVSVMIVCGFGGGGLLLAGLGYFYLNASRGRKEVENDLAAHGVNAQADVIEKEEVRTWTHGSSVLSHFIIYQFDAPRPDDGARQVYRIRTQISLDDFVALEEGSRIGIRYLPGRPETAMIVSGARDVVTSGSRNLVGVILLVGAAAMLVIGLWMNIGINQNRANREATVNAYDTQIAQTPEPFQLTQAAQASADRLATMQAELDMTDTLGKAIEGRIEEWKQVTDQKTHRLLPPDTGLGMDEVAIDYGYCDTGRFYVYIWLKETQFDMSTVTWRMLEGYSYIEDGTPENCRPVELLESSFRPVQGDWYVSSGHTEAPITP